MCWPVPWAFLLILKSQRSSEKPSPSQDHDFETVKISGNLSLFKRYFQMNFLLLFPLVSVLKMKLVFAVET
jgi:hypothetical protein